MSEALGGAPVDRQWLMAGLVSLTSDLEGKDLRQI